HIQYFNQTYHCNATGCRGSLHWESICKNVSSSHPPLGFLERGGSSPHQIRLDLVIPVTQCATPTDKVTGQHLSTADHSMPAQSRAGLGNTQRCSKPLVLHKHSTVSTLFSID